MSDEQRPQKRARLLPPVGRFLDIEADVDGDDEGDEEYLEELDADEEADDEEEDVLSHRTLAQEMHIAMVPGNTAWDNFMSGLESRIQNRGCRILEVDKMWVGKRPAPLPSDLLYEIPCTVGKEEELVFKLMSIALGYPEPKAFALSIFARKAIPGRIYVEALSAEKVASIARTFSDLNGNKVRVVPRDWMTKLLKATSQPSIAPQMWVRIRNVPKRYKVYRDDIALVVKVDKYRIIQVCLAPRLGDAESGSSRARRGLPEKDDLKEFNKLKLAQFTEQGYLLISGPVDMVTYGPQVCPSADEIRFFLGCKLLDPQVKASTEAAIIRSALKVGDRVKVTGGSMLGLSGKIEELFDESATVYLGSLDISEPLLLRELRADFRPGDQVRVTGGGWKGALGWVIAVGGDRATVYKHDEFAEDSIALINMEFHEEWEGVRLRDISAPSNRAIRDGWEILARQLMRENPNAKFKGKQVMIVGNHRHKGVLGTIRDTTSTDEVIVEVHLFNQPHEKISLSSLRLYRDKKMHALKNAPPSAMPQAAAIAALSRPPETAAPAPATPMHNSAEAGSSMSPAWDPSSTTPLTIVDADIDPPLWLADERMKGLRIQLVERGGNPFRIMEFKSIADGAVTMRDGMETHMLPVTSVIPILANRKQDPIVCFAEGDNFGKLFKIKTFGVQECSVRIFGTKAGKGEKLCDISTASLAVVYPPTASVLTARRPK